MRTTSDRKTSSRGRERRRGTRLFTVDTSPHYFSRRRQTSSVADLSRQEFCGTSYVRTSYVRTNAQLRSDLNRVPRDDLLNFQIRFAQDESYTCCCDPDRATSPARSSLPDASERHQSSLVSSRINSSVVQLTRSTAVSSLGQPSLGTPFLNGDNSHDPRRRK